MDEWKEVTFRLIEEGNLERDLDCALREAQTAIAMHVSKFGAVARNAKAGVTLAIDFVCLDPDDKTYGVRGAIKIRRPDRPVKPTVAVGSEAKDGTPILVCRATGTAHDHPSQMVFEKIIRKEEGADE